VADVVVPGQRVLATGLVADYETPLSLADNYIVANTGRTFLHVVNGGGSPTNVTIVTPRTVGGLAVADRVVAVAAGAEAFIGPFPVSVYSSSLDVSFDFITSVSLAALTLP
jgi:hypothetical protein